MDRTKAFKITDYKREKKVGIVTVSLEDLKSKTRAKLDKIGNKMKIVLESDGTEIDDEDFFNFLNNFTCLMVLFDDEKWSKVSQVSDEARRQQGARILSMGARIFPWYNTLVPVRKEERSRDQGFAQMFSIKILIQPLEQWQLLLPKQIISTL